MSAEKCPNCKYVLRPNDIYKCPNCGYDVKTVIKLRQLRRPAIMQDGAMACVASGLTCLFLNDSFIVMLISVGVGYLIGVVFFYITMALAKALAFFRISTAEQSAWIGIILIISSGISTGIAVAMLIKIP